MTIDKDTAVQVVASLIEDMPINDLVETEFIGLSTEPGRVTLSFEDGSKIALQVSVET